MKYFLLVIIGILPSVIFAQTQKKEVEQRIPSGDFPPLARKHIEKDFPNAKRLKFYREITNDTISFEAKFCSEKNWYSVEFTPEGKLLDIEKKVKFRTIPEATQTQIKKRWDQDFKKYRVKKCQEQTSSLGIRYEIEVRGRGSEGTAFYEYLFAADGTFLQKREIVLRSSDVTLY